MNQEQISQNRNNRLRLYYDLPLNKVKKKDFFETSKYIYLGNYEPYELADPERIESWYKIEMPHELRWLFWSQSGFYKTTLLKILIPYFVKKGYKLCIIEAKDFSLGINMKKQANCDRLVPGAYNCKIETVSHCPSYLFSSQRDPSDRIDSATLRKFDKKVTLNVKSIKNAYEWQGLLGASQGGADILVACNKQFNGNIDKMKDQIRKGYVKDSDNRIVSLHGVAKNSVLMKINKFMVDEVFNAKKCQEMDLEEVWDQGKVATITFNNQNPEYMKIYVAKIIQQEYQYAERNLNKGIKILNIFDDCQLYLNQEAPDNNPANKAVINTLKMGRTRGINSIFTIQSMVDFNYAIYDALTGIFAGYIRDFANASLINEHKQVITENRKRFREVPLPNGYTQKTVAYYHIPTNDNLATTFYPADPNCAGY